MALIEIGQPAPDFNLRDQEGRPHTPKEAAGRPLVLYFYPKDATSVCTTEACQFRDHHADFEGLKAVVMGVSPDDQASHNAFAKEHSLGFPILSDTDLDAQGRPKVAEAYGAWEEKNMYGRKYMGVARTTYLIDGDGKVAKRWDNVRIKGHIQEVIDAVGLLQRGELKDGQAVPDAAGASHNPRHASRASRMDPKFAPARDRGPNSAAQAPPRAGAGRAQKGK